MSCNIGTIDFQYNSISILFFIAMATGEQQQLMCDKHRILELNFERF